MASVKVLPRFDAAECMKTDEDIAWFMADAMSTGDPSYIAHVLGLVARAKGMSQIAQETGLSREQLYRSFSESGNPTLKTLLAVLKSVGVTLAAQPITPSSRRALAKRPQKRTARRKATAGSRQMGTAK